MVIENYREQPPGSYALALFDVYLPKAFMTLRQMKLCLSKKGTHFIGYPSFSTEELDAQGRKKWSSYFEFSEGKKKEFENLLFEELTPFVKGGIRRFSQ